MNKLKNNNKIINFLSKFLGKLLITYFSKHSSLLQFHLQKTQHFLYNFYHQ